MRQHLHGVRSPWCRIPFEHLIVAHVMKFTALYGTWSVISVYRDLILSQMNLFLTLTPFPYDPLEYCIPTYACISRKVSFILVSSLSHFEFLSAILRYFLILPHFRTTYKLHLGCIISIVSSTVVTRSKHF